MFCFILGYKKKLSFNDVKSPVLESLFKKISKKEKIFDISKNDNKSQSKHEINLTQPILMISILIVTFFVVRKYQMSK